MRPDVERLAVGVDEDGAEAARPDLDDRVAAGRDRGGDDEGSDRGTLDGTDDDDDDDDGKRVPRPSPAAIAERDRLENAMIEAIYEARISETHILSRGAE